LGLLGSLATAADADAEAFVSASATATPTTVAFSNIKAQKVVLARIFNVALQERLRGGCSTADSDQFAFLLQALSSCICVDQPQSQPQSLSQPQSAMASLTADAESRRSDVHGHRHGHGLPHTYASRGSSTLNAFGKDFDCKGVEPLSVPELMKWIWDSYSHNTIVAAAVLRLFGGIGENAGAVGRRKLLGNVTVDSSMQILLDAVVDSSSSSRPKSRNATNGSGSGGRVLTQTAAVALWAILHHSERARAVIKSLLNSDTTVEDNEINYAAVEKINKNLIDIKYQQDFVREDRIKNALTQLLQ